MTTNEKVEMFFRHPSEAPNGEACNHCYSTLYLLRRDIFTCYGIDPETGGKLPFKALFPGVISIMAGIDLLAKFQFGDDRKHLGVGERFMKFTQTYIEPEMADWLYQLRNALCHSFGLYSEDKSGVYHFVLSEDMKMNRLIAKSDRGRYYVQIEILRQRFEDAIPNFKRHILESPNVFARFEAMFKRYGAIGMKQTNEIIE